MSSEVASRSGSSQPCLRLISILQLRLLWLVDGPGIGRQQIKIAHRVVTLLLPTIGSGAGSRHLENQGRPSHTKLA
jgi:hypothetical protein